MVHHRLPEQFFADSPNGYMLSRAVLLSHLHRVDATVAPDVEYMMGLLDEIMQYMMGLCGMNKFRDSLADTRILPAIKIVEFHQNCVQALPSSNEAMMQLPHWDNAVRLHRRFTSRRGGVLTIPCLCVCMCVCVCVCVWLACMPGHEVRRRPWKAPEAQLPSVHRT